MFDVTDSEIKTEIPQTGADVTINSRYQPHILPQYKITHKCYRAAAQLKTDYGGFCVLFS